MQDKAVMNEMKEMIESKTDCMIESYGEVLKKTAQMFIDSGIVLLGNEETYKRADMFWNIALQRIDKEVNEAKAKVEQEERMKQQMQMQGMPPQGMPQSFPVGHPPEGKESPCAKKARESAEKIVTLEAEIKESKKDK